jgi:hypothetical protein
VAASMALVLWLICIGADWLLVTYRYPQPMLPLLAFRAVGIVVLVGPYLLGLGKPRTRPANRTSRSVLASTTWARATLVITGRATFSLANATGTRVGQPLQNELFTYRTSDRGAATWVEP